MARPPKNAEGPSATERMETAFWDCMREMPFSEITVRDIVQRANVNRNSYYYHYDSMWDLAQASVRNATSPEFAHMLLGGELSPLHDDEKASASYEHLHVLFGPNGNQRLIDDAKRIIVGEWLAGYQVESDELDVAAYANIDFVFGGMAELVASDNFESLDELMASIRESTLLSDSLSMVRAELGTGASTPLPGETIVVETTTHHIIAVEEVHGVVSADDGAKEEQVSVNTRTVMEMSDEVFDASLKADELVAAELKAFAERHESDEVRDEAEDGIDAERISIFDPKPPVPLTSSKTSTGTNQETAPASETDHEDAPHDEALDVPVDEIDADNFEQGPDNDVEAVDSPIAFEPGAVNTTVKTEPDMDDAHADEGVFAHGDGDELASEPMPEIVERVTASEEIVERDRIESFEEASLVEDAGGLSGSPRRDEAGDKPLAPGEDQDEEEQLSFDMLF